MRYERYRKTGIPWLPEVPEEWDVAKVRQHFRLRSEKVSEKDFPALSVAKIGVVPQLSDVALSMAEGDTRKLVREGDFVVNSRSDRKGSGGIAPRDGSVTTISIVLEPHNIYRKFVHYLFRSIPWVEEFYRNGRGIVADLWTTRYQEMRNMLFPLPPLPTQCAIVVFLDEKCGKVDRLVAAKEKGAALLKELKQSIIAEAVTGKVNVANVKMLPIVNSNSQSACAKTTANKLKTGNIGTGNIGNISKSSGIPWLPEVPEGWEVRKIKYLFKERSEKGHPEEPPLCSTQAYGVIPQSLYENRVVTTNKEGLALQKLVKVGDFVISLRAFQGGIEIAHYQGIISAAYTILEPCESNFAPYFRWLFKAQPFIELLKTCVTGIREGQNINYQLLSRKFIPLPPLAEQKAIVAYIEAKAAKIDAAVAGLEREIAALKEYRERLIADVVTGQRRVA